MKKIIETERLYLREMTEEDYPDLCEMLMDDETMVAYNGVMNDLEAHEWLDRQLGRYARYGFGFWAVCLKETNEMVGQCGLTMQPWKDQEVLEIGYMFKRKHWHHGYATEAAVACKEYAFETLGAEEVYSIIKDTNDASQRVALRNGMTKTDHWVKHYRGVDMLHDRFIVRRDAKDAE